MRPSENCASRLAYTWTGRYRLSDHEVLAPRIGRQRRATSTPSVVVRGPRREPACIPRRHPGRLSRLTEVVVRARESWTQAAQRRSLAAQNAAVETGPRFHHQGNHRDLRVTCPAHRVKPLRVDKWFSWRDDRRKTWLQNAQPSVTDRRPVRREPRTVPASAGLRGSLTPRDGRNNDRDRRPCRSTTSRIKE